jgi:hypothetical protein
LLGLVAALFYPRCKQETSPPPRPPQEPMEWPDPARDEAPPPRGPGQICASCLPLHSWTRGAYPARVRKPNRVRILSTSRSKHHPWRFYGGMIEAFRTEKVEWQGSEDLSVKYDRKAHDYVYYLRASAISAVTTWAAVSAASHITIEGGKLWADVVLWRARQPIPPLEPPAPPPNGGGTLPGQLPLFNNPM